MNAMRISTGNTDYVFFFVSIFGSVLCSIILLLFIYLFVRNIIRICRKKKTIKKYEIIENFPENAISKSPYIENSLSIECHRDG
ncbi:hypothetical protein EG68_05399 [Paragonimus skrjabini miyazakii]|uniref:Uncharacterized protein n=1 Tax=Paragonimus skrjabini miyazakii TaxID=59628 RepID=A0A8S9YVN4_9TREM|nr:hypothetical protein EG68_05399 [Paragonimus skrjabini miyazakii]